MHVRSEVPGGIEASLADALPRLFIQDLGLEFEFPNSLKRLALSIVIHARAFGYSQTVKL